MLEIEVKDKYYKDRLVLKDIDIRSKKEEIISIVGPSGCGKSTLLKIIASLDKDFSGSVLYCGKSEIESLGFIFQDSRLLPWLSVKENILLVSKTVDESRVDWFLEELSLKEYKNSYPKELSGGMQRRVSMIRAFINNPNVILLDEPFISLDEPTAKSLRELFLKLYSSSKSNAIFVTHNLDEALAVSDRIIFLSKSPTSIIYEYINSNKSFDETVILSKKEDILEKYPNILSGSLG